MYRRTKDTTFPEFSGVWESVSGESRTGRTGAGAEGQVQERKRGPEMEGTGVEMKRKGVWIRREVIPDGSGGKTQGGKQRSVGVCV